MARKQMASVEIQREAGISNEIEIGRFARKRAAILEAATDIFLANGYLGASMDDIAALSSVSKQTVYKHFVSKEALFIEIVGGMTSDTGDVLVSQAPEPSENDGAEEFLSHYAFQQLTLVLTPRVMQLRRMVIGEVGRFPELGKVLYERGPKRAMARLAKAIERLTVRGLLTASDPATAAAQFNWLIMSAPLNQAMLLGDEAIPKPAELRRHAAEGVRMFLAAYGRR
jgi:TetR/AcrR family transcriptional regulator, mexJK operon transcriptional repressor